MSERLDAYLVKQGLAPSREQAKDLIRSGKVSVGGKPATKASFRFEAEEGPPDIQITGSLLPYVSRGGLKLEKALTLFEIPLTGRICMDVGSSTGGFTDCMLQSHAAKVYAIDTGTGQLAKKLREDPRVVVMENTNMRYVTPDLLEDPPSFASVDVSFISLTKILLPVFSCLVEGGETVCLIKPQFEAGRKNVGKRGVVKDRKVQAEVISQVIRYACQIGFAVKGLDYSPVKGPEGNIEFLLYLKKCHGPAFSDTAAIGDIVSRAHSFLD